MPVKRTIVDSTTLALAMDNEARVAVGAEVLEAKVVLLPKVWVVDVHLIRALSHKGSLGEGATNAARATSNGHRLGTLQDLLSSEEPMNVSPKDRRPHTGGASGFTWSMSASQNACAI